MCVFLTGNKLQFAEDGRKHMCDIERKLALDLGHVPAGVFMI